MQIPESQPHFLWLLVTSARCLSPASRLNLQVDVRQRLTSTALGTETTAVVLIYLTYHLASHEDIWDTLRLELAQVNLQADGFMEGLRRLPYLNAFLRVGSVVSVNARHAYNDDQGNTQNSRACACLS